MDPHEPFLKAILASRHDDLPRLVYADWLEETAEPANVARAHFIRTQIHLESTDPRSDLYHEMKALEARILDWYLEDWRHELPEPFWNSDALQNVRWRRGFPDDLGPMSVAQFYSFGATTIWQLPITSLHLSGRSETFPFDRFLEFEQLSNLTFSSFHQLVSPLDDELVFPTQTFSALMAAPVFGSLRHLGLSENRITDAWLIRFAAGYPSTSFAPTLETLDLSGNFGITDAGANVLATAPGLDRLKSLRLRDTSITSAGMGMLKKRFGKRVG